MWINELWKTVYLLREENQCRHRRQVFWRTRAEANEQELKQLKAERKELEKKIWELKSSLEKQKNKPPKKL